MDVEPLEPPSASRREFSVPILEFEIPGFTRHRSAVVSYLESGRVPEQRKARSNRGGWRSPSDLGEHDEPALRWIIDRIGRLSELGLRSSGDLAPTESLALRACWATVNRAGDWNVPHSHYGHDWSGVCYIAIPESPNADLEGDIIFIDPLGRKHGHPTVTNIAPKEGHLLLFPAHLVHLVAPHSSGDRRISLAFNLDVVQT